MKIFLLAAVTLLTLTPSSHARWQMSSEFQLQLPEPLFDKILTGLQDKLPRKQENLTPHAAFTLGGVNVRLNGVRTQLSYDFINPRRLASGAREWQLGTSRLAGKITVGQFLATFRQQRESDGTIIDIEITVECRNLVLSLPAQAGAGMNARVRAEVSRGRMNFSLAQFQSRWPAGAWKMESLQCSQLENIQGTVQAQIMEHIGQLANVDKEVEAALGEQLIDWSNEANKMLLGTHEIPTGKKHLKIFQEVREIRDHNGEGLSLNGVLSFDYPFVSRDKNLEIKLPAGTNAVTQDSPQLLIPFAAVRALMEGEYLAGQLQSVVYTNEIPGFAKLMNSRKRQLFAWPNLLTFEKGTNFRLLVGPRAVPDCRAERYDGKGGILCGIDLPLEARMFAPIDDWLPYVNFSTRLHGQANLRLQKNGKIKVALNATDQPVDYDFAPEYLEDHRPHRGIAVRIIARVARESLNKNGMEVALPELLLSKDWQLLPQGWSLLPQSVLKVDFTLLPKKVR